MNLLLIFPEIYSSMDNRLITLAENATRLLKTNLLYDKKLLISFWIFLAIYFFKNIQMNDCDYNGVYEMFRHLYGEGYIAKPEESVGTVPLDGDLFEFDQREYFVMPPGTYSMDTIGRL